MATIYLRAGDWRTGGKALLEAFDGESDVVSRRATERLSPSSGLSRLEKRWLELARSFEFGESLDTFFCAKASPFMVNGNPNKLCSPIFNPFRPPRRGRATEQPNKAVLEQGFDNMRCLSNHRLLNNAAIFTPFGCLSAPSGF